MKKLLFLLVVFLNVGCSKFLTDYSQDLVVVKTTTDLDEIILGSAYLGSRNIDNPSLVDAEAGFLNFLDDDINTVVGIQNYFPGGPESWVRSYIYGYTTWQLEVNRAYDQSLIGTDDNTWINIYKRINIVNMILKELENVSKKTDEERLAAIRIEGEALFLRAQFYLLLSNLYGDAYNPKTADAQLTVPLKLTEYVEHVGGETVQFERATAKEVYNQIVDDLKRSIACFEESPQTKKLYRASGPASLLLLSRVYLYMQDWENAFLTASRFVNANSNLMNLNTHVETKPLLDENNREIIFSQGALGLQNVLKAYTNDMCVSRDLYEMYDENDSRKNIYFSTQTNTDSIALYNKYRMQLHQSKVSDRFMLRNAEGYLNLAEAAAMLGNTAEASKALNTLRQYRIKEYTPVVYDASTIVQEVRNERRRELCFEGHRWFDLRRYAANQIQPYSKDIIRSYAVLNDATYNLIQIELYRLPAGDPAYTFTIPKSVIEFEPGLTNNPREARPFESLAN